MIIQKFTMDSSSSSKFLLCASFLLISAFASDDLPEYNFANTNKWGSLHPKYAACSTGKSQSPIDIITKDVVANKTLKPLTRKYVVHNASLVTDGIEVEILFTGKGDVLIDGKTYKLKQMHWHTPSEHRLNGVQYAAELHQVHVADDGSKAIVGILQELGKPDPVLAMLKPQLDELAKEPCQNATRKVSIPQFDSTFLRKRPFQYFRYPGSLTTPPCDENVIWNILKKVKSISKEQVEALKAPLCQANKIKNARPTQPLNGRKIQSYDGNGNEN